jgi:hypothetical protein
MCGAIPPHPNTPSWRGAQKRTGTLPLPFTWQVCLSDAVKLKCDSSLLNLPLICSSVLAFSLVMFIIQGTFITHCMFLGLSPLAFFVSKLTFETVNPF